MSSLACRGAVSSISFSRIESVPPQVAAGGCGSIVRGSVRTRAGYAGEKSSIGNSPLFSVRKPRLPQLCRPRAWSGLRGGVMARRAACRFAAVADLTCRRAAPNEPGISGRVVLKRCRRVARRLGKLLIYRSSRSRSGQCGRNSCRRSAMPRCAPSLRREKSIIFICVNEKVLKLYRAQNIRKFWFREALKYPKANYFCILSGPMN